MADKVLPAPLTVESIEQILEENKIDAIICLQWVDKQP